MELSQFLERCGVMIVNDDVVQQSQVVGEYGSQLPDNPVARSTNREQIKELLSPTPPITTSVSAPVSAAPGAPLSAPATAQESRRPDSRQISSKIFASKYERLTKKEIKECVMEAIKDPSFWLLVSSEYFPQLQMNILTLICR